MLRAREETEGVFQSAIKLKTEMAHDTERQTSNREIFESDTLYPVVSVSRREDSQAADYVGRQLKAKLDTVRRYISHGLVVDLCCGTGDHLVSVKPERASAIGIDFSTAFLREAMVRQQSDGRKGITFVAADARMIPLASGSVSTLYSLAALYLVPGLEQVIAEISRVLKVGGRCILDLGNSRSLNSYCVNRYYPELPKSHHVSVAHMRELCALNKLQIVEHRAFQILPLWAGRPRWLWPLLHPVWRDLLSIRVCERMIDERVSSLPIVRNFAFRHLLVCERTP